MPPTLNLCSLILKPIFIPPSRCPFAGASLHRCSSELGTRASKETKITYRLVLILVAVFLCCTVFSLLVFLLVDVRIVAHFVPLRLYHGRRPESRWGRNTVQVHVLCGLAASWIFLTVGMIPTNHNICNYYHQDVCGLFTSANILVWFLIAVLFGAANMVLHPTPPMVAAWRLSHVADAEGAIKI
ncbi:hypothetical protein B0H13DRAFT_1992325 [Mycena leptocephala]|nr:hypothetical protein B0H13DRAFT_1992325 [Mycena leptocephala]